jgi:hypothetical protein
MKYFGWFLVIFGVFSILLGIVTGEVCLGKGKMVCYLYSEDPKEYWRQFFIYPSLCFAMGKRMIIGSEINLWGVLDFIFIVLGGVFLGRLISLLY